MIGGAAVGWLSTVMVNIARLTARLLLLIYIYMYIQLDVSICCL